MKRMDVGCVAMVILMLNEAGKAIPLGNEFSENAVLVHLFECTVDIAGFLENSTEA